MQRVGIEHSAGNSPVAERASITEPSRGTAATTSDVLLRERDELLAKVQKLETELERYRSHAQRTSKLFQSVTSYRDWIRENSRRDAELVLKKARARADRTLGDLERERDRAQRELLRLQALTEETRTRLSAFTAAALEVLTAEVEGRQDADSRPTPGGDLQNALQNELSPSSHPARAEAEKLEPRTRS